MIRLRSPNGAAGGTLGLTAPAEGGRWHDDDTADTVEPNGIGGHNTVIHTLGARLDQHADQHLGSLDRSDGNVPSLSAAAGRWVPGPVFRHERPASPRALGVGPPTQLAQHPGRASCRQPVAVAVTSAKDTKSECGSDMKTA